MTARRFHALVLLGLVALTVSLYAQTLDDEWHFDDLGELTPGVRAFAPRVDASHYRGVVGLWLWAVDYRLHGEDPAGYHVTNGVIHLVNSALVFWLAWSLLAAASGGARRLGALTAAAIFCAHPLATQAVTYLTQRSTSLATLFALVALASWAAFRRSSSRIRWTLYGISLGALLLGLHTKHVVVIVPVAVALYELLHRPRARSLGLALLVPAVLVTGSRVLDYAPELAEQRAPAAPSVADRTPLLPRHTPRQYALAQPRSIAAYAGLFLFARGQNLDRDVSPPRSVTDPATLASIVFLVALPIAAWRLRHASPTASFGLLFFLLALAPTSSVVPSADLFFEHRAYLPMAGLALAVGAAAGAIHRRHPAASWLGIGIVVIALSAATVRRNAVWDTELSLWSDAVAKSPAKARPHVNLGLALQNAGRLDEAERHYRRALEIHPDYPFALNNLGNILRRRGQAEEAERLFLAALEDRPWRPSPWINLGNLAMDRGELATAESRYREALQLRPTAVEARYNLAKVMERQGRAGEAVEEYARAVDLRPDEPLFLNDLGCARLAAGDPAGAEQDLRQALRRKSWEVSWYNLGLALEAQGRAAEAAAAYDSALTISPGMEPARVRLDALRRPGGVAGTGP
jgi:Tfp pilus assembly protein PilF